MKIIEPSAVILEPELAGLSICQRIDRCASVCYQRPPRPTEEDAEAFCRHLIERGHFPALEMAVVHLAMPTCEASSRFLTSKYIKHHYDSGWVVLSGSIRAFVEFLQTDEDYTLLSVGTFLAKEFPVFFQAAKTPRDYPKVRFAIPKEIPWQHRHVAVRVICSRAISLQLIRHRPCSFLQESQRYCRYDDEVTFIRPEWAADREDFFELQCLLSEGGYKTRLDIGLSPQQARGALIADTKTELIIYASLPEWKHIFKMRCAKAADPEMRRIMIPLREQFRAEYPEMWEGEK